MRAGSIVQLLRPITIKTSYGFAKFGFKARRGAPPEVPVRVLILPESAATPAGLRIALINALADLDAREKGAAGQAAADPTDVP